MAYNKASEEKKWWKWKLHEEKLLKMYGVPEHIIEELHQYDWSMFNSERRFLQKQFTNSEFFNSIRDCDIQIPIEDIHSLIDFYIENERLFYFFKNLDELLLQIIFYKFCGYSNREISRMFNVSEGYISKQINMIRKKITEIINNGNF